ncbi:hypothetical protein FOVG_17515 [Fusarium oxysporum f. sp. pisi HDV247]|uniref:Aminotransferase class I/classII large domain-containing protein n=1 Tax=Fusarium oxysporum f. sp. pisi HDV247 TaxID=1080344 RepID=W9NMG1_FUSOX|nr:hypothetical protein FOVG_17515 [Fusarium oxysporum f. sp. pisi HDV247]
MTLSTRCQEAAQLSETLTLWKVVRDLWDPDANPSGFLNLGIAENSLMHDILSRHVHQNINLPNTTFTYGDGTIEHLAWACANPGEAFLLGQPYWGTFVPDLTLRFGAQLLPVPFHDIDPLEDGDEIYALSVWSNDIDANGPAPAPFTSILSIDPGGIIDPARILVVWGMSKDFGASGLRVGSFISQSNEMLHKAMTPVGLYTYVSAASDHIAANILEDSLWKDAYIVENQKRLSKQYEFVIRWARDNHISHAPGVNAAFFVWLDLGSYYQRNHPEMDVKQSHHITKALLEKKVFLASGADFGSEKPGWFRIVFAHEDHYLQEGLTRIIAALEAA